MVAQGAQGVPEATGTIGLFLQIIMQTGALGLLAIIVWQMPKLFKELREWRQQSEESHLKERNELKHERGLLLEAYRSEARYEREACQKHFDKLADLGMQHQQTTHQVLDRLGDAVHHVGDAVAKHDDLARSVIKQIIPGNGNNP